MSADGQLLAVLGHAGELGDELLQDRQGFPILLLRLRPLPQAGQSNSQSVRG